MSSDYGADWPGTAVSFAYETSYTDTQAASPPEDNAALDSRIAIEPSCRPATRARPWSPLPNKIPISFVLKSRCQTARGLSKHWLPHRSGHASVQLQLTPRPACDPDGMLSDDSRADSQDSGRFVPVGDRKRGHLDTITIANSAPSFCLPPSPHILMSIVTATSPRGNIAATF